MDLPETDLIVGLVGALVLAGLVVGLFAVGGSGPTEADDGTTDPPPAQNTTSEPTYRNDTLSGTVPAGAVVGGDDQTAQEDTQTFDVGNGTTEIRILFTFSSSEQNPGDLDCHLYDPNGTKHGDEHCHQGTPDDPMGANFTLEVNATHVGEWEFVAHTGKTGNQDTNLNSDMDYTAEIVRVVVS